MNSRGMFSNVLDMDAYQEGEKQWYVELQQSSRYWYELIINDSKEYPFRKNIFQELKELKNLVKEQLDKRFIYFITTRQKIRFSKTKKPRYAWFGNKLYVYLEIGANKKKKRIAVEVFDEKMQPVKFNVETTDTIISLIDKTGLKMSFSVHDFLEMNAVDLGITSEVHYVGYTKNPDTRPINGLHAGLTDTLYNTSKEEYDVFVYYNLFKVTTQAANKAYGINFVIPNSMTDEVKVDQEGLILEKCLILYFDALNQNRNREKEKSELENHLIELANEFKIKRVIFDLEMEQPTEYFRFGSSAVETKDRHWFTCEMSESGVEIKDGKESTEFYDY